ncbi:MAG: NAD(P)-dependent oxidoreductase [Phycisphaerales bacterium JB040]
MSTDTQSMRVIVFGGAGDVGRRMVREGVHRGHRVTAVGRRQPEPGVHPESVTTLVADVGGDSDLTSLIADHDAVISALRPPNGEEGGLVALTEAVVSAAIEAGRRFLVVGGAAPLFLADGSGHTVLSAPGFLPDSVVAIAEACHAQHDWVLPRLGGLGTYLCPPAMLSPGIRTGAYRLGTDTLVTGPGGDSRITFEDFAVAALDELERPAHTGRRFTVGA